MPTALGVVDCHIPSIEMLGYFHFVPTGTNRANARINTGNRIRGDVQWLINELNQDEAAEVVYVDKELFLVGAKLYHERSNKVWGLVDCISFSVMQSLAIVDAFTADRHFQQAGFSCLLK